MLFNELFKFGVFNDNRFNIEFGIKTELHLVHQYWLDYLLPHTEFVRVAIMVQHDVFE